jgi:ribosome-binding factor A
MTRDKKSRERMLAHCDSLHDDDGVDPRQFFKPRTGGGKIDRKTRQLCAQVAETLALVLAGEIEDDTLQSLRVEAVDPAPDASQLAVTLRGPTDWRRADVQQALDRLAKISGRLRCEVAAAITRKRAPKLVFHIIGSHRDEETQQ